MSQRLPALPAQFAEVVIQKCTVTQIQDVSGVVGVGPQLGFGQASNIPGLQAVQVGQEGEGARLASISSRLPDIPVIVFCIAAPVSFGSEGSPVR